MKRTDAPGSVGGLYDDAQKTRVVAGRLNDFQEEIANAIEGAGLTLDGDDRTQLLQAIQDLAAAAAGNQKPPVVCRTTANITLVGEQTIDGAPTSASRVLVAHQNAPAENGVWISGAGAWTRAPDFDAWSDIPGAVITVLQGTLYGDSLWLCTNDPGGTLGTTAIAFKRVDIPLMLRRATIGTSEAIASADFGKFVTTSNAGAVAVSIPSASSLGHGFWFMRQNLGAGAATDTPASGTVNGGASLVSRTGDAWLWMSDGANWTAIPIGLTYTWLVGLTADASGATGDFVVSADISATLLKKITLATIQTLFAASQADVLAASSNVLNVTPGRLKYHPGVAKFTATVTYSGGTPTLDAGFNVLSITDTGPGRLGITIDVDFANDDWTCVPSVKDAAATYCVEYRSKTAGTVEINAHVAHSDTGGLADPAGFDVAGFGTQ